MLIRESLQLSIPTYLRDPQPGIDRHWQLILNIIILNDVLVDMTSGLTFCRDLPRHWQIPFIKPQYYIITH